jgi:putative ABC transport system permease protein
VKLSTITEIHLHHISELKPGGKWQTVVLCILLSALLIGVACFNFVNMSMAQIARRAQETGIRKAIGASRTQLVMQFLFESWLVTVFSIVLACAIVELSLPMAESLIGREVSLVFGLKEFAALLVLSVVVAVLAGLYPALYISSFATLNALSGELSSGQTANRIRKILLGLQAAFSISLITAVIIFSQQLKLLRDIDTGFATDNRLIISGLPNESVFTKENTRLLTRLNQIPNISLAAPLDTQLTHSFLYSFEVRFPNGSQSETPIPAVGVGFRAVESLGLKLIAGRDFSSSTGSDWFQVNDDSATVATIITESLSKLSGFASPQEAIGQTIQRDSLQLRIIGVVEDIQLGTARENYNQVFFVCGFTRTSNMNMLVTYDKNLNAEQRIQMTSAIEATLAEELYIFEPSIRRIEDDQQETLGAERSLLRIISVFSVLAILLACIGIFGLASFSSHRRKKEVALRKVLGASELSLVNLLSKEYLWLVAGSVVLAWPLSYWLMATWLQGFSQQVDQSILVYLFATFIVAAISWITSASLAFKTAVGHPAGALRHE